MSQTLLYKEKSGIEYPKQIRVVIEQTRHFKNRGNKIDLEGKHNNEFITIGLTEEDYEYIKNGDDYVQSIHVDPVTCTHQELKDWSNKFNSHHDKIDDIICEGISRALGYDNYRAYAITKDSFDPTAKLVVEEDVI